MRGRTRYAGAMLLYGSQAQPPDLTLAMQFLIDDLRFDGRKVNWIALKSNALRLRVEGYELVLAHSDGALPAQAFHGVLRPLARRHLQDITGQDITGDATASDSEQDLARGRVLHSLRHHPCALSVLLRPRGARPAPAATADPQGNEAAMLALLRECRALLEPVIEAAAPATVIWQPGAVAYTCEEFLASRAETLALPGDTAHPLMLVTEKKRPRERPTLQDPFSPANLASPGGTDENPLPPDDANPRLVATAPPQSRSDRVLKRSAGHLFGIAPASSRPAALPRLHRQDARIADALRERPAPQADAAARSRQRRLNLARIANVTALALWYMQLLPSLAGLW